MAKEPREFISYATDWDVYEGDRDWSGLSIDQQNRILRNELSPRGVPREFVMLIRWRKRQANGLRATVVAVSELLKRSGRIANDDGWDEAHQTQVCLFLAETALGKRMSEALESTARGTTRAYSEIDGRMLEAVAFYGQSSSLLDAMLDMEWDEGRAFINRFLGPIESNPRPPSAPPPPVSAHVRGSLFGEPWRNLDLVEKLLVVEAAMVGNRFAIRYLGDNIETMRPPLMPPSSWLFGDSEGKERWEAEVALYERATKALGGKDAWRVQLARWLVM